MQSTAVPSSSWQRRGPRTYACSTMQNRHAVWALCRPQPTQHVAVADSSCATQVLAAHARPPQAPEEGVAARYCSLLAHWVQLQLELAALQQGSQQRRSRHEVCWALLYQPHWTP